jgi:hypothetical protein
METTPPEDGGEKVTAAAPSPSEQTEMEKQTEQTGPEQEKETSGSGGPPPEEEEEQIKAAEAEGYVRAASVAEVKAAPSRKWKCMQVEKRSVTFFHQDDHIFALDRYAPFLFYY